MSQQVEAALRHVIQARDALKTEPPAPEVGAALLGLDTAFEQLRQFKQNKQSGSGSWQEIQAGTHDE